MGEQQLTARDLARGLPPKTNLANVASLQPSQACDLCRAIVPDRSKRGIYGICTESECQDRFPDFPALKASGKAGCAFCYLLRKTIRATWLSRPIRFSDYYDITDGDGEWERVLDSTWDGMLKISRATFQFTPFGSFQMGTRLTFAEDVGSEKQNGGQVTGLSIRIQPANPPIDADGDLVEDLSKVLHFKVYDSIGKVSPIRPDILLLTGISIKISTSQVQPPSVSYHFQMPWVQGTWK